MKNLRKIPFYLFLFVAIIAPGISLSAEQESTISVVDAAQVPSHERKYKSVDLLSNFWPYSVSSDQAKDRESDLNLELSIVKGYSSLLNSLFFEFEKLLSSLEESSDEFKASEITFSLFVRLKKIENSIFGLDEYITQTQIRGEDLFEKISIPKAQYQEVEEDFQNVIDSLGKGLLLETALKIETRLKKEIEDSEEKFSHELKYAHLAFSHLIEDCETEGQYNKLLAFRHSLRKNYSAPLGAFVFKSDVDSELVLSYSQEKQTDSLQKISKALEDKTLTDERRDYLSFLELDLKEELIIARESGELILRSLPFQDNVYRDLSSLGEGDLYRLRTAKDSHPDDKLYERALRNFSIQFKPLKNDFEIHARLVEGYRIITEYQKVLTE
ncbi:MAG: hypothetical protein ACPGJV_05435 [Bacteriovoracaceae bacterium]